MKRRFPAIIAIFLLVFSVSVLAAASKSVDIREWDVSAPGSFPHDPAVTLDGSLSRTPSEGSTCQQGKSGNIVSRPAQGPMAL